MINIVFSAIHNAMRGHARDACFAIIVAFGAGVFPDAISHGALLPGREGHFELAILGLFLIAGGMCWFCFSGALARRYGTTGGRTVALVANEEKRNERIERGYGPGFNFIQCQHYNKTLPMYICRKCGRCKK